jgi:serine phosphatase RsbU (regulator of sigma subunit)
MGNLAVGGDWYDVIDLDEDRRSLIVGDCVGHGLDAATVMAQLRSAARAMVLEGRGPAAVLEGLDSFAAHLDGALCTTVVCTTYDRAARQLTYARAGHPPPLIAGPRGFRWLDGANGPPLAVATDVSRTELTHRVEDDEILVLYSDGLVERRNEHIDLGLARLVESAARQHEHRAQAIADGVLRDLLPENARDDVVLVVKRFRDVDPAT